MDHAEKVKDIIEKELGVEREKLTDNASFIEDLGADSLDIVELVMEFEKEFNIDIPDEDAEKLRTVGDALKYMQEKSIARELASRNILVNAIAPGYIETDMTAALSAEARQTLTSQIPLDRLGTPSDVAFAVTFLASDYASYITGQVLVVDGGMVM